MFNDEVELSKRVDPNRPNGGEVGRFNNKDNIINDGKDLYNFGGVLIRKLMFDLGEESVDGIAEVGAKDCCGKAFALEDALGDLEESKG